MAAEYMLKLYTTQCVSTPKYNVGTYASNIKELRAQILPPLGGNN